MVDQIIAKGLEGVVASETALSYVDGEQGRLFYRGYDIHDLAENGSFAEGLYLLWQENLPTRSELREFRARLAGQREIRGELIDILRTLPASTTPMGALRTAISADASFDSESDDNSPEANQRKAVRLVARIPTLIAAFHRIREGEDPIEPDPSFSHAADFLRMLRGEEPREVEETALDTSLLLYLEHGLNASTFTCRVIASTLSDLHSAITGGISALKGSLHGGANQKAMEMLLEIGSLENAESWVDEALAQKKKIMGFGHRVYRTEDPRATVLRRMASELSSSVSDPKWFEIARRVEETMLDRKGIDCNVDYYCAIVYHALGIPLDLYTPLFAAGRMGGWCGHVLEQHADNRLIRPRAEYVGRRDREYVPIDER